MMTLFKLKYFLLFYTALHSTQRISIQQDELFLLREVDLLKISRQHSIASKSTFLDLATRQLIGLMPFWKTSKFRSRGLGMEEFWQRFCTFMEWSPRHIWSMPWANKVWLVDTNAEKMNCPAQNYAPVLDSVQNNISSYKNNK